MSTRPPTVLVALTAFAALVLASCSDREAPAAAATATAATGSATSTSVSPAAKTATPSIGSAAFEGTRALTHLKYLAETIGARVAGTEDERAAATYIRDQFRSYGYSAEIEEFSFAGDRFQLSSVTANGTTAEALAMAGSSSGKASGPGVFVGLADDEGIAGRDLRGKVAVADRGTVRFVDKYTNARAAGAVALIVINNQDGEFSGNLDTDAETPVVSVTREAGSRLREAAERGESITVETPISDRTTALNVVARPVAEGDCLLVVGGHHDTVPGTPGAHDNASGTADTLEVARAMAADGLDRGICFATFGAEESGLYGSAAFADQLAEAGGLPKAMLNLDTTGTGRRLDLIGTAALTAEAATLAKGLGIDARPSNLPDGVGSDHQSFADLGVPVLFIATDDFSKIHTPGDTVAEINVELFTDGGELALAIVRQVLARVAQQ